MEMAHPIPLHYISVGIADLHRALAFGTFSRFELYRVITPRYLNLSWYRRRAANESFNR